MRQEPNVENPGLEASELPLLGLLTLSLMILQSW